MCCVNECCTQPLRWQHISHLFLGRRRQMRAAGQNWAAVSAPMMPLKTNFLAVWSCFLCHFYSGLFQTSPKPFSFLPSVSLSDVLALPIFKQEDSSLPSENETKNPPFQYVLCAATSPAVKLHDETLTYLNQGGMHACIGSRVTVVERLCCWISA